jgi:hypothetical protein
MKKRRIYNSEWSLHNHIEKKNRAYAKLRKSVLEAKRKAWSSFINNLDSRKPTTKVYEFMKNMNNGLISSRRNPLIIYGTTILVNENQKVDAAAKFISLVIGRKDPNSQKEREMEMKAGQFGTQVKDEACNRPFSEQVLRNVIRNLPNTSPRPDEILPQVVKLLPTS